MTAKLILLAVAIALSGFILYRGIEGWFSGWSTVPTLAHLVAAPTVIIVAVWFVWFRVET